LSETSGISWIGIRTHFTVEVLRENHADEFAFAVLAALQADVQLVRPASFTHVRGITA
jgi:hypothetical protein